MAGRMLRRVIQWGDETCSVMGRASMLRLYSSMRLDPCDHRTLPCTPLHRHWDVWDHLRGEVAGVRPHHTPTNAIVSLQVSQSLLPFRSEASWGQAVIENIGWIDVFVGPIAVYALAHYRVRGYVALAA
jgi:hypothetical protein